LLELAFDAGGWVKAALEETSPPTDVREAYLRAQQRAQALVEIDKQIEALGKEPVIDPDALQAICERISAIEAELVDFAELLDRARRRNGRDCEGAQMICNFPDGPKAAAALVKERPIAEIDGRLAGIDIDELGLDVDELVLALAGLIGDEPGNQDEMGGCVYCGGTPPGEAYGYAGSDPRDHDDDCPWIRGRRLLDRIYAGTSPTPA
jgi:hypothetical protein